MEDAVGLSHRIEGWRILSHLGDQIWKISGFFASQSPNRCHFQGSQYHLRPLTEHHRVLLFLSEASWYMSSLRHVVDTLLPGSYKFAHQPSWYTAVWAAFSCHNHSIPPASATASTKKPKIRTKTTRNNSSWHSSTLCSIIPGLIKYTLTGGRSWYCKPGGNRQCLQNIREITISLTWSQHTIQDNSDLSRNVQS